MGTPLRADKARPFFGDDVPASGLPDSYWRHPFFELPAFRPPVVAPYGTTGIPHLNLDAVLVDAIGGLQ